MGHCNYLYCLHVCFNVDNDYICSSYRISLYPSCPGHKQGETYIIQHSVVNDTMVKEDGLRNYHDSIPTIPADDVLKGHPSHIINEDGTDTTKIQNSSK